MTWPVGLSLFWLSAWFNKSNIGVVSVWPSNHSSKCHVNNTKRRVALRFPASTPGNSSLYPSTLDLRGRVCLSFPKAQQLPSHFQQRLARSSHLSPKVMQTSPSHPLFPYSLKSCFQVSHFLKTKNFPLSFPVLYSCSLWLFLILLPKLPERGRLVSPHPPPHTSSIHQRPAVLWLLLLHLLKLLQARLLMTSWPPKTAESFQDKSCFGVLRLRTCLPNSSLTLGLPLGILFSQIALHSMAFPSVLQ